MTDSQSNRTALNSWALNAIAIALGLAVSLVLVEFACRLSGLGAPNLTLTGNKQLFAPDDDPLISFRLRPGYEDFVFGSHVKINNKGLRDDEIPYQKPDNETRILLLGDSVTFGYGVPVEETFADQWEAWLNENSETRWQVINSGVPSYTTVQEARWFETEGLRYQPDAVIVTYVMNDPEPVHQLLDNGGFEILEVDRMYRDIADLFPDPILPFTRTSHAMNFINRSLLHAHPNWQEVHDRMTAYFNRGIFETPYWDDCLEAFEAIRNRCDEEGIFFLIIQHPLMFRLHSIDEHSFMTHYERVERALIERGIAFVNPLPDYIGESVDAMRAYVDDPHPSAAAHRIHAQRLNVELQRRWAGYQVEGEM